ncbi:hypothetical protein LCGC14_1736620 [marine sediment metagenome]|uniref:DnaB/C C-terminal domain-containing protein n=1 Tax=marine sediment metagenome TaxID=412755 RepID=A0A0F9H7T4_9ZZZZ
MPRRMVTSEIFRNDKVAELDPIGRLFFIGLITNADDDGRIKGSVKYLKANIFPYDNISLEQIMEYRDQCHELGIAIHYNVNGREVITLPHWKEHQRIRADRYKQSSLPPPDNQKATRKPPKDNQKATPGMRNIVESNIVESNIIKQLGQTYEKNIGILTPLIAEELKDISNEYSVEWFEEAVKEACKNNVRKLKYITSILERWKTDGFKSKKGKVKDEKKQEFAKDKDPDRFVKGKYGHMVQR